MLNVEGAAQSCSYAGVALHRDKQMSQAYNLDFLGGCVTLCSFSLQQQGLSDVLQGW